MLLLAHMISQEIMSVENFIENVCIKEIILSYIPRVHSVFSLPNSCKIIFPVITKGSERLFQSHTFRIKGRLKSHSST